PAAHDHLDRDPDPHRELAQRESRSPEGRVRLEAPLRHAQQTRPGRPEEPARRSRRSRSMSATDYTAPVSIADGPIVRTVDINKWFGDRHILTDVSLEIERGEVVVLVGPSGAGKTTFLRT